MASTFSNLKFELIGTGEQSGVWGATTNTNIGTAIEQAIVGMATLVAGDFAANVCTLALSNSNAAQDARALCLKIDSAALSGAGTVNVPAIEKPYIVINGSSYAVTVKVTGQTGVTVPAGKRTIVYNDATDVGNQIDYLLSLTAATLTVSGVATFSAGTAAAPAITTTGDTNTGVFFPAADTVAVSAGGTEGLRLDSSRNLLVGTTTANAKAYVVGTTSSRTLRLDTGGTSASNIPLTCFNEATTGNNVFAEFGTETSYTARGSIDYDRENGLTRYNTTSDYRTKDIIGPLQNTGAVVDALQVYEGVMKGATQSRPMLIAHEAQQHVPYAVTGVKDEMREDGSPMYQQMDVSSLVPLLIAEIQSLRARVAALESN